MDYNGDVLYSYDKDDFIQNVNELPPGPTWHSNLTFQEWNWDLADIKDELQNGSGACCIGACYETTDGKTHFIIDLKEEDGVKDIQFYRISRSGSLIVDWGDDTVETLSGNALTKHSYSNYGKYDIAITGNLSIAGNSRFMRAQNPLATGSYAGYSITNRFLTNVYTSSSCTMYANGSGNHQFAECINLKTFSSCKQLFSSSAQVSPISFQGVFNDNQNLRFFVFPKGAFNADTYAANYAFNLCFKGCQNMVSISFPKMLTTLCMNQPMASAGMRFLYFPSVTTLDSGNGYFAFDGNRNLQKVRMKFDNTVTSYTNGFAYALMMHNYFIKDINFDKLGITGLAHSCFYNCYSYDKTVTVASTVTQLNATFYCCYNVPKIVFLGDLTTISGAAFYNCLLCLEYNFTHCTTVPALAATNAFTSINTNAKIVVPDSLVSSWKAASNWSAYASYIIGESDYNA